MRNDHSSDKLLAAQTQSPGQSPPDNTAGHPHTPAASRRGHPTPPSAFNLPPLAGPNRGLPRTQPQFWGAKGISRPHAITDHTWAGQKKSWPHPSCRRPAGRLHLVLPNGPILGLARGASWVGHPHLIMMHTLTALGPSSPAPSRAQPEPSCPLQALSLPHFSDME